MMDSEQYFLLSLHQGFWTREQFHVELYRQYATIPPKIFNQASVKCLQ